MTQFEVGRDLIATSSVQAMDALALHLRRHPIKKPPEGGRNPQDYLCLSASALLGARTTLVIALLLVLIAGAGLLALARTLLVLLFVLRILRLAGLFVRTSAALRDAGVARIIGAALLATGVGVVLVLLSRRTLVVAGLLLARILTLAGLLTLTLLVALLVLLILLLLLLLLAVVLLIGHVILLVIRSLEDAGGLDRRSVGENPSCPQADRVSIGARRIRLWADIPAAVSGLLTWNAIAFLSTTRNSPIEAPRPSR
jgi:MFS family permease